MSAIESSPPSRAADNYGETAPAAGLRLQIAWSHIRGLQTSQDLLPDAYELVAEIEGREDLADVCRPGVADQPSHTVREIRPGDVIDVEDAGEGWFRLHFKTAAALTVSGAVLAGLAFQGLRVVAKHRK